MKLLKTIIFGIVVLLTTELKAAVPNWSINANAFQYTMTVTAKAKFNCDESTNPNNKIGAFINGNLAGFARVNTSINGEMYAYITVYSNVAGGDTVRFKMYDAANDTLLDSKYKTVFQENASIGNASSPFVQKSDYELQEISINTDTIFEYNQIGDSVVFFQVENENLEPELAAYSFINDATGTDNSFFTFTDGFLVMAQNVDFLNKNFYNIHVKATNSRGCSIDTSLVISVKNTNTPPTGILPNPIYFDENQVPGSFVSVLTAEDLSPNDTHTYEILSDLVNFPDNAAFSIFNDSLFAETNFDNDIKNLYTLQVKVTDNLLGVYIDTVIVYINGLIEFTSFTNNPVSFDENQIGGLFITQLVPVGILPIDTHTFVLSTDTTNFPDNQAFTIATDSLLSNWNYDFETQSVYTLQIEVRDKFNTLYLDTFIVNINDLVEFTSFTNNPVSFDENQIGGLFITQFVPVGILPTDTHTFVLSADTANFPDNQAFTIATDSLLSNWNYDFETQSVYTLQIEVRDKFNTLYLDTFIVNINDLVEFTEFLENPVFIDENTGPEILVSSLTPTALPTNHNLTFVLSADTVNFPDNNVFWLHTDSLINKFNFDYEKQSSYELLIEVRDQFDTLYLDTFYVYINDIEEFEYFEEDPIYFDENQAVGTLVSTLVPIGSLAGDDLTFVLSSDSINFPDNRSFTIKNDELLSAEIYNYEQKEEYRILVEVTNAFGTKYLDTMTVFIKDVIEQDDLKANNVITPNNDGYNDFFTVPNVELFKDFEFVVYSENGNLIYRRSAGSGYNNLWNGKTTKGEELPQGVYYYLLRDLNSTIEFKGEVTLLKD